MRILFSFLTIFILFSQLKADEGMWIPLLLEKYNYDEMKEMGFKLSPEDIYSINQASMKDAVVIFGGGCTGELISDEGLLITNHHCGYGAIQSHSTVEHDYLTDGFWAMNRSEELTNPGLSVTFLVRMEDVTEKVLKEVSETMTESQRSDIIKKNIAEIKKEAIKDTHYEAVIKPFFQGNAYYMFINEVFKDVRMVGAPPSAIGKFGGDTDNWMWPRHTGDFSLFRIYADKDNKPAEYNEDNVPYKPKRHFPVSLKGIEKGDFTMVFGYPGRTQEYLPSDAVEMITEMQNPHRIKLREKRLEIMKKYMDKDVETRINYASKYAHTANAWKKWIGENRGLKRLNAIEKKKDIEKKFNDWLTFDADAKKKYGGIISLYDQHYKEMREPQLLLDYIIESILPIEIFGMARNFMALESAGEDRIPLIKEKLTKQVEGFFKSYNADIDKEMFAAMLEYYAGNIDEKYYPEAFKEAYKKHEGNMKAYANYVFEKSFFASKEKTLQFIEKVNVKKAKKLSKDPVYNLYSQFIDLYYAKAKPQLDKHSAALDSLDRLWMKALMEMHKDKVFYPDANFTLRVAYGKVDDYEPKDGVEYDFYTTLEGIIEKDNPDIYDYDVPDKLKELYKNKDYGQYADNETGEMPVCFTASNHTTGGNSGSPVINGEGHLIGVNFDRNWEGTMSDIMYDPEMCRNITLDIRYALFIIDKFAGAGHLLNEMTIIK